MFGAFAPMPLRLGGGPTDGWAASQQSRACADLVACFRSCSLAVLTLRWDGASGSTAAVVAYHGQDGPGLGHAPAVSRNSSGDFTLTWPVSTDGPLWARGDREDQTFPWTMKQALCHPGGPSAISVACAVLSPNSLRVVLSGAGDAVVEPFGQWSPLPQIGTYGGDPDKENSVREGSLTYAAQVYEEILGYRGSAYARGLNTVVGAENLSRARFWGAVAYRLPERVRANATPVRCDERLPYWERLLGVGRRPGEEDWSVRRRCSQAYRIARGASFEAVNDELASLLGPVLVDITFPDELPLDQNPPGTYWYPVDTSYGAYSLTGSPLGIWTSRRAQLRIKVTWPATLPFASFYDLVNVRMSQLLDVILPAWMTWSWYVDDTADGFILDRNIPGVNANLTDGSLEPFDPGKPAPGRLDIDGFNDQG